eukprot:1281137-Amphidinium_carterae.1
MDGTREQNLEAVKRDHPVNVPERYWADRKIVLVAVNKNGYALKFAAEQCKADHEIVLTAVQRVGRALEYAAEECKAET